MYASHTYLGDIMINKSELPLGFGMALAQHPESMKKFSNMSDAQQKEVISKVHSIQSKQEMQSFVSSLAK